MPYFYFQWLSADGVWPSVGADVVIGCRLTDWTSEERVLGQQVQLHLTRITDDMIRKANVSLKRRGRLKLKKKPGRPKKAKEQFDTRQPTIFQAFSGQLKKSVSLDNLKSVEPDASPNKKLSPNKKRTPNKLSLNKNKPNPKSSPCKTPSPTSKLSYVDFIRNFANRGISRFTSYAMRIMRYQDYLDGKFPTSSPGGDTVSDGDRSLPLMKAESNADDLMAEAEVAVDDSTDIVPKLILPLTPSLSSSWGYELSDGSAQSAKSNNSTSHSNSSPISDDPDLCSNSHICEPRNILDDLNLEAKSDLDITANELAANHTEVSFEGVDDTFDPLGMLETSSDGWRVEMEPSLDPQIDSSPMPQIDSSLMPQTDSSLMLQIDSSPMPPTDSSPMPQTDSSPMPQTDSSPMPQTDSSLMPQTDSSLMPQTDSSPMPQTDSSPMPQIDSSPMPQTDSSPMSVEILDEFSTQQQDNPDISSRDLVDLVDFHHRVVNSLGSGSLAVAKLPEKHLSENCLSSIDEEDLIVINEESMSKCQRMHHRSQHSSSAHGDNKGLFSPITSCEMTSPVSTVSRASSTSLPPDSASIRRHSCDTSMNNTVINIDEDIIMIVSDPETDEHGDFIKITGVVSSVALGSDEFASRPNLSPPRLQIENPIHTSFSPTLPVSSTQHCVGWPPLSMPVLDRMSQAPPVDAVMFHSLAKPVTSVSSQSTDVKVHNEITPRSAISLVQPIPSQSLVQPNTSQSVIQQIRSNNTHSSRSVVQLVHSMNSITASQALPKPVNTVSPLVTNTVQSPPTRSVQPLLKSVPTQLLSQSIKPPHFYSNIGPYPSSAASRTLQVIPSNIQLHGNPGPIRNVNSPYSPVVAINYNYNPCLISQQNQYRPPAPRNYTPPQANYTQSQANYTQSQANYTQSQANYTQSQANYTQSQANYTQLQGNYTQSPGTYPGNQPQRQYLPAQANYFHGRIHPTNYQKSGGSHY